MIIYFHVGVLSSIEIIFECLDSGIVLTLQGPLRIVLFFFVLYCILYVLWMYIYIWKLTKLKKKKHAGTSAWRLGLDGDWPAPVTLAQHLTDIGLVSACNRRQQY